MLEVSSLSVAYGGVSALRDVTLRVDAGEIVALIGSNGAGKSSLLKCISGLVMPRAGAITYLGASLMASPPNARARAGIAVVPENRRLFGPMSVLDNLLMGSYARARLGRMPDVGADLRYVFHLFPRLAERRGQLAQTLSGGEQQMLAIGRALMSRPRLILMDEPSIGLAPLIVKSIFDVIKTLRDGGRTILLVEQNAAISLQIADRAYVLERGQIHLEGNALDLRRMDKVRELYLGGGAAT